MCLSACLWPILAASSQSRPPPNNVTIHGEGSDSEGGGAFSNASDDAFTPTPKKSLVQDFQATANRAAKKSRGKKRCGKGRGSGSPSAVNKRFLEHQIDDSSSDDDTGGADFGSQTTAGMSATTPGSHTTMTPSPMSTGRSQQQRKKTTSREKRVRKPATGGIMMS